MLRLGRGGRAVQESPANGRRQPMDDRAPLTSKRPTSRPLLSWRPTLLPLSSIIPLVRSLRPTRPPVISMPPEDGGSPGAPEPNRGGTARVLRWGHYAAGAVVVSLGAAIMWGNVFSKRSESIATRQGHL